MRDFWMVPTLLTLRSSTQLLKWMGPWSSEKQRPTRVKQRAVQISPQKPGQRPLEAWVYTPEGERPFGAILLAPGLFPDGPEDRRLDRICRILAAAGNVVLIPFLPDYMALRLTAEVSEDTDRAFEKLLEQPECPPDVRPGIFSISFGSLPALRVASAPHRAAQVGGVMVFGGYADWQETMHFTFTGEMNGKRLNAFDPTNQPVVFMNLLEQITDLKVDPEVLLTTWRKFALATWGQPAQKARYKDVARELAHQVPEEGRELFLIGCGAEPGGYELAMKLLAQARRDYLDPRLHLKNLQCPVCLIHSRDDDVIPVNQLDKLVEAMPPHVKVTTYLTGAFRHDGGRDQGSKTLTPEFFREMMSQAGILYNFSQLGLRRGPRNVVDTTRQQGSL